MINSRSLIVGTVLGLGTLVAGAASAQADGAVRAAQLKQAGCVLAEYFTLHPSRTAMLDAISEYNLYGTKNDQRFANRMRYCNAANGITGKVTRADFAFQPGDEALPKGVLYELCMGQAAYQPALSAGERSLMAAIGKRAVKKDATLASELGCSAGTVSITSPTSTQTRPTKTERLFGGLFAVTHTVASSDTRGASINAALCVTRDFMRTYPSRTGMIDAIAELNLYGTKEDAGFDASARFGNRSRVCAKAYPKHKTPISSQALDSAQIEDIAGYEICMGVADSSAALIPAEHERIEAAYERIMNNDVNLGAELGCGASAPGVDYAISPTRAASLNAALCTTSDYMALYPSRTGMMDALAELNMYGTSNDLNINANARFGNRSRFCAKAYPKHKEAITANALDTSEIVDGAAYEVCMGSGSNSSALSPAEHRKVQAAYARIMSKDTGLRSELGCR